MTTLEILEVKEQVKKMNNGKKDFCEVVFLQEIVRKWVTLGITQGEKSTR